MLTLKDEILIKAPPEKIFEFFEHLNEDYPSWHPDHTSVKMIEGSAISAGSRIRFEETIYGMNLRLNVRITNVEKNVRIDYDIMPGFKGSLILTPKEEGTLFTAKIMISIPFASFILNKILPGFIRAILKHMYEEGINLKRIMEEGYSMGLF